MTPSKLPDSLLAFRSSTALLTFTTRPIPLYADYRPMWRVPLLALMLRLCCQRGQSSLKRLHILNWAVRTQTGGKQLLALLDGSRQPGDVIVRVEPTLNFVVDLALGENVVSAPRGDRVQLTPSGIRLADDIIRDECLLNEKSVLRQVDRRLTEALVNQIVQVGARQRA